MQFSIEYSRTHVRVRANECFCCLRFIFIKNKKIECILCMKFHYPYIIHVYTRHMQTKILYFVLFCFVLWCTPFPFTIITSSSTSIYHEHTSILWYKFIQSDSNWSLLFYLDFICFHHHVCVYFRI